MTEPTEGPQGATPVQKAVTRRRLIAGAGGRVVALGVTTVAALVNFRISLDYLGLDEYGLLLLVTSLWYWAAVGDLGLGTAVQQRTTVLLAGGKVRQAAQVLSSGVLCFTALGILLFGVLWVLHVTGVTALLITGEGIDVARAARVLLLGVAVYLVMFPIQPLSGVLLARNDLAAHYVFVILFGAGRPLCTYIALSRGASLEVFLLVVAGYRLLALLAPYVYTLVQVPALRVRPSLASFTVTRSLLAPSLYFFVMSVGYTVIFYTDNAVISAVIGVAAIPAYAAAFQLFRILRRICLSGVEALFPAAGILDARGQQDRLQALTETMARLVTTLAILAGAGLALFGEAVISAWLGPEVVPPRGVIWVLAGLLPVAALVNVPARMVSGVGRHRGMALICVVEMVLNLGLSIALAGQLGLLGVALGTLLARALVAGPYLAYGTAKLGMGLGRFLRHVLPVNLALAGVLVGVVWLWAPPTVLPVSTLLLYMSVFGVAGIGALVATLPGDLRRSVLQLPRRPARAASVDPPEAGTSDGSNPFAEG